MTDTKITPKAEEPWYMHELHSHATEGRADGDTRRAARVAYDLLAGKLTAEGVRASGVAPVARKVSLESKNMVVPLPASLREIVRWWLTGKPYLRVGLKVDMMATPGAEVQGIALTMDAVEALDASRGV